MKVLLIVTNLFIFEEELSALDSINRKDKEVYFCANPDYCDENASAKLREFINRYYPNFIETNINYFNEKTPTVFEYVLTTSYIQESVHRFLSLDNWQHLEVVEDGTYDYFMTKKRDHKGNLRGSNLWVWKPSKAIDTKVFARVFRVYSNDTFRKYIKEYFCNELQSINENMDAKTIIYTSPLLDDFGISIVDTIENFIESNKNKYGNKIFIKRHPRDKEQYKFKSVESIEISRYISSQFIYDSLPNGIEKLYLFPSTQVLYDNDTSKNTLVVFNELYKRNSLYKDSIDKMSILFDNRIITL